MQVIRNEQGTVTNYIFEDGSGGCVEVVGRLREWELITNEYGERRAARSKVPLINHIIEGVAVLNVLQATEEAIKAFIVHPLFQGDDYFFDNVELLRTFDWEVIVNLVEYRRAANAYLCREHTDAWGVEDVRRQVGGMSQDVRHMLIADKWQNRKDFRIHHLGTHQRSKELERYFEVWLEVLGSEEVERVDRWGAVEARR